MKKVILYSLSLLGIVLATKTDAQTNLPKNLTAEEIQELQFQEKNNEPYLPLGYTTPPGQPVRNMAQWEEVQALTIAWTTYTSVLREIVKAAQKETKVVIVCGSTCGGSDSNSVKNTLTSNGIPLTNLKFVHAPCNSVWIRDFMANSCYLNDVDSLILVDWKYNRPRPSDDTLPSRIAKTLSIPLFETTKSPNLLVHTGGNYMTDGLGTSFSSKLVLNENTSLTEPQINSIMQNFMGVSKYIKMDELPYDGIHHIDMHMKLLDEETLLVGQYPTGVSDGPQIEANIQYVLSNFTSSFGTPYKVIRIPQPPDPNGNIYPNNGGDYLTYTNSTIINKTVIVPQFYQKYDTTAIRIWKQAMPGYTVVGINSNATISASGSLHCITHSVGVKAPLWMVHQQLPNTNNTTNPYKVDVRVEHKTGIQWATLYYTTDTTQAYQSVNMSLTSIPNNTWTGYIPAQPGGTTVYYYIKAHANSGKEQVRPMVAPKGTFKFKVTGLGTAVFENGLLLKMDEPFPNPSKGITCIPAYFNQTGNVSVKLYDMLGKEVNEIFNGEVNQGEKKFFINTISMNAGMYFIVIENNNQKVSKKLIVR